MNGEQVFVVDISPEELTYEIPTIIMPGFSATPEALKDSILRTAEDGRRVISAYAPHGIEVAEQRSDLPEAEMRKLELLLTLIEAKGLEKVNVISNSEASIYVTAAAVLYPEKFSNIVYVEPAGLIGDDSFFQLLRRTHQDIQEEKKHKASQTMVKFPSPSNVGPKSIMAGIGASIKEIQAIAKADITPGLIAIHEAGVGVSIIHAVDDKIFPMDRVQQMLKAHMIHGLYSVKGTHNSIYSYEPYGRASVAALKALENRGKTGEEII